MLVELQMIQLQENSGEGSEFERAGKYSKTLHIAMRKLVLKLSNS